MAATVMIAVGQHYQYSHSLSDNSSLRGIRNDLETAQGMKLFVVLHAASE